MYPEGTTQAERDTAELVGDCLRENRQEPLARLLAYLRNRPQGTRLANVAELVKELRYPDPDVTWEQQL